MGILIAVILYLAGAALGFCAFVKGFGLSVESMPWLVFGYLGMIILYILAAVVKELD